ncbi:MAG: RES family NAD+ phosphorylase [Ginsengibacter sp.]
MLVYRIVHKKYSTNLFASGLKGRWNSAGKKVIYTSESIPLAFLENMVRRQGVGFNSDFKIMIIDIPDSASISVINLSDLESGWRDFKDYSKCQPSGDKWYDEGKSLVLKVPSAVLSEAFNYVINSEFSDFKMVKLIAVTGLVPDERIEDILKKYKGKG